MTLSLYSLYEIISSIHQDVNTKVSFKHWILSDNIIKENVSYTIKWDLLDLNYLINDAQIYSSFSK